jgi:hypothetical protein
MGEVVNVLVAFAVIVFIFRWATSGMCTYLPRVGVFPPDSFIYFLSLLHVFESDTDIWSVCLQVVILRNADLLRIH